MHQAKQTRWGPPIIVAIITTVMMMMPTDTYGFFSKRFKSKTTYTKTFNKTRTVKRFTPVSTCTSQNSHDDFKGEASLVYFYMGDSYLTTLFQESVQLNKQFEGYDYKVLLYDTSATATSKVLSSKAIKNADSIYKPTRENFFKAIREIADEGYVVNIYITSHGNTGYYDYDERRWYGDSTYFVAQDGRITEEDIRAEFANDPCGQVPIRMVYSGACYHEGLNDAWKDVGAKVTAGAIDINFYPTQTSRFATKWKNGYSFKSAINASNTYASRAAVNTYIGLLGLRYSRKGECRLIPNVIGRTNCAEWYFTGGGDYNIGDAYNSRRSGSSNMYRSSRKVISGDKYLTLDDEVSWDL